jgi:hypothetical protein
MSSIAPTWRRAVRLDPRRCRIRSCYIRTGSRSTVTAAVVLAVMPASRRGLVLGDVGSLRVRVGLPGMVVGAGALDGGPVRLGRDRDRVAGRRGNLGVVCRRGSWSGHPFPPEGDLFGVPQSRKRRSEARAEWRADRDLARRLPVPIGLASEAAPRDLRARLADPTVAVSRILGETPSRADRVGSSRGPRAPGNQTRGQRRSVTSSSGTLSSGRCGTRPTTPTVGPARRVGRRAHRPVRPLRARPLKAECWRSLRRYLVSCQDPSKRPDPERSIDIDDEAVDVPDMGIRSKDMNDNAARLLGRRA